jgi:dTMP kinase
MGFIVIEGLDGSGKSTQIGLIENYFREQGTRTKFIHFPRTNTLIWGELISKFLRGDLGDIDTVNPYLVALIYAGDRKDAADQLMRWMKEGHVVIADRYLYSNIAFQCAKIEDRKEQVKLARWIKHFEYEYNKIPLPDLNLFLDVPFHFTEKSLGKRREGADRNYLNGATDIHEADLVFQQRVRDIYLEQVRLNTDFEQVGCADTEGRMLSPEEIAGHIVQMIKMKFRIS